MRYAWINGDFVESSQASLGVEDLAVQRGYGVFDFFRCKGGVPFLLTSYLERFYNSADCLNLKVPMDRSVLKNIIAQFIQKNQLKNEGVKMILTGGYALDRYTPQKPNLIISSHQITPPGPDKYKRGFRVMSYSYQRELPSCKSINYLQGIKLIPTLAEKRYDDVLYHSDGSITEFPRSNVFIVDAQNRLATPAKDMLHGITRKLILHLAKDQYSPQERDISLSELKDANEVFLTSTTKRIMPICEVDGIPIGTGRPGPISRHLASVLDDLPTDFNIGK
jgi:branched-chain amino acid aminotransferase